MDNGIMMEAAEDGLSMDTFVAGGTYTLSLVQQVPQDSESRDWTQKLESLVGDDTKCGRIKLKLLDKDAEYRAALFDGNENAVRTSLLGLIEPAAATAAVDNALTIWRAIIEQCVRLCKVDELHGLLKTELKDDLRFPVFSGIWNSLPTSRAKLFKPAGPAEECYNIMSLVNIIVTPPMPRFFSSLLGHCY